MIQSSVDESFTKPRTVGRVGVDGIALDVAERQIGLQFPRLRQRDLRLAETYAREMCRFWFEQAYTDLKKQLRSKKK